MVRDIARRDPVAGDEPLTRRISGADEHHSATGGKQDRSGYRFNSHASRATIVAERGKLMAALRRRAMDSRSAGMPLDPLPILQSTFGFPEFRGVQRQVVDRVLGGLNTLAVIADGRGASRSAINCRR